MPTGLNVGSMAGTFHGAENTATSMAQNALGAGEAGLDASSTESKMSDISNQMNQMTLASAQMQLQQSMAGALSNVMKSGASNVKSASQGG